MAIDFVPIEMGKEDFSALPELLSKEPTRALVERIYSQQQTSEFPSKLIDLPYTDTLSQLLTLDRAVSLGLPIGNASVKGNRQVFVQQFQRYTVFQEGKEKVLVGVGVRWLLEVETLKAEANLSSLAMLTASAQFGYLSASARFDVIGMMSEEIDQAIPAPTVLNVETHAVYSKALLAIMGLMWKEKTIIRPRILSVPVDVPPRYEELVGTTWALKQIAAGRSMQRALSDAPKNARGVSDVIRAVYMDLVKLGEDVSPSEENRELAKQKLSVWNL